MSPRDAALQRLGDRSRAEDRMTPREADLHRIAAIRSEELRRENEVMRAETPERALDILREESPQLFGDVDYATVADRRINRLINQGMSAPEAILAAGRELSEKLGLRKSSESAQIDSSNRTSQIISEMRAARLLSPAPPSDIQRTAQRVFGR